MIEAMVLNRDRSGALSHDGYIVFITAEFLNVFFDPVYCIQLIIQTEIPVSSIAFFDRFMAEIAKHTDPVIGKDAYNAPLCQLIAPKRFFRIAAGIETAAMEKEDDRTGCLIFRHIDVQIQAVFIVGKIKASAKLVEIE